MNNDNPRVVGEDEMRLFYAGVLGELRTLKLVDPHENDLMNDVALCAVSDWGNTGKIGRYPSVVDALVDFQAWVKSWTGVPDSVQVSMITVSLTIPVQSGSATFGASGIVMDGNTKRAYTQLYKAVIDAVKSFPNVSNPTNNGGNNADTKAVNTTELIEAVAIKVENRNGKTYYRLAGGRWLKFGVAVWPEVWEKAGIDPSSYPVGDHPFKARMVVQLGADGKPEKVLEILK